jgi:hypothetical protein
MTVDHATESPPAAGARVLQETTRATWRFTAIRELLSIGAFEQLAGGPLTTDELADRCGANPEILRRMLRCVAATGLLRSAGPHRYELTDACRAVMDGWAFAGFRFNTDPETRGACGTKMGSPAYTPAWHSPVPLERRITIYLNSTGDTSNPTGHADRRDLAC